MSKEEEFQAAVYEYEALRQESENLSNLMQNIEARKQEYEAIISSIEELKKKRDDVVLPLATGVFVKANVVEDGVLINVGSNIVVNKSFDDGIKYLRKQIEELTKTQSEISAELTKIANQLHNLEHKIMELNPNK